MNAQAYDEYLKGLYLRANDRSIELQAALEHFKRAVDLDPDFIQGFSALATTHLRLALRSSSAGHWQQASTAAHQAIERDSDLAEAHLAKGLVELYREWDFAAAEASLRRALELAPGWGDSHSALASYLATLGHYDEAIPRAKLARRLDPAKFSLSSDLCWYLIHASRFADAELECSRALELEPEHALSLLGQAEAARRLGNFQLALESTARALRTSIPAQDASSSITPASRLDRLWQEASAAESTPIHSTSPYFAAVAAALAGHEEKAIALLTRARDRRYPALLHFRTDPRLESIKSHPEYAQLVESIGFPDP
ncbi:MAG: tetratricopeptide repeat protein [Acidobacteriota bacterium]